MKKLALTLTLALLLTGCQRAELSAPTSPSAPSPSPTVSAVPALTPEPTPSLPDPGSPECPPLWTSLPKEGLPVEEEKPCVEEGNILWRVFYHDPELDATLYDVTYTDETLKRIYAEPAFGDGVGYGAQFVLQVGDNFGEVFRGGYWSDLLGHLAGGDYDGDGEREYVVSIWREFFLCKPNGEGGWDTYYYNDEELGTEALPLLTVEQDDRSVTVYCGASSASYRMGEGLPGKISLFPLDFSQMRLRFEFSEDGIWADATLMTVGEDGGPSTVFGHLRGQLVLKDEKLTLASLRVEGIEGV